MWLWDTVLTFDDCIWRKSLKITKWFWMKMSHSLSKHSFEWYWCLFVQICPYIVTKGDSLPPYNDHISKYIHKMTYNVSTLCWVLTSQILIITPNKTLYRFLILITHWKEIHIKPYNATLKLSIKRIYSYIIPVMTYYVTMGYNKSGCSNNICDCVDIHYMQWFFLCHFII